KEQNFEVSGFANSRLATQGDIEAVENGSSDDRRRKAATKLAWCRLVTSGENGGSKRARVSKPTAEERFPRPARHLV
ncbi:hypothetical protein A2U01_0098502, partial [Trifolium medium]|nr:hypothetical protein [Trifolium medium]